MLRGVISQRLVPRTDGGRVAAVEVMVANSRIADLIRENKAELITEAIADGEFFHMQTLTAALIELVLTGAVDRDVAAAAAPNHHDFVIALERALKEQAAQRGRRRRKTSVYAEPPPVRCACALMRAPPVRRGGRHVDSPARGAATRSARCWSCS